MKPRNSVSGFSKREKIRRKPFGRRNWRLISLRRLYISWSYFHEQDEAEEQRIKFLEVGEDSSEALRSSELAIDFVASLVHFLVVFPEQDEAEEQRIKFLEVGEDSSEALRSSELAIDFVALLVHFLVVFPRTG